MNVFGWALANWKAVGLGVLLLFAVTSSAVAYNQWKDRVQLEAIAGERAADAREAHRRAEQSEEARIEAERELAEAEAAVDSMRAENDSLKTAMLALSREASARYVAAGRTLSATIDSITVAEDIEDAHRLARAAREQNREKDETHREQVGAQARALDAQEEITEAERRANSILRRRLSLTQNERDSWKATALEYEATLEARTRQTEGTIYDHWTVKALALGAAAYAGYRVGVSR